MNLFRKDNVLDISDHLNTFINIPELNHSRDGFYITSRYNPQRFIAAISTDNPSIYPFVYVIAKEEYYKTIVL